MTLCLLEGLKIDPYLSADGMFSIRPLVPHLGALLIVLAALVLARGGHDVQGEQLIIVAESTYVLYLMHAYLLLAFAKFAARLPAQLAMTQPSGFVLVLGLSITAAVAVHIYIEKPVMAFFKHWLMAPRPRIAPYVAFETAPELPVPVLFQNAAQ